LATLSALKAAFVVLGCRLGVNEALLNGNQMSGRTERKGVVLVVFESNMLGMLDRKKR